MLLVDDSPTIVALLRKLLRQNGYGTHEAGDAETGIELARSVQPDVIFRVAKLESVSAEAIEELLARLLADEHHAPPPIAFASSTLLAPAARKRLIEPSEVAAFASEADAHTALRDVQGNTRAWYGFTYTRDAVGHQHGLVVVRRLARR